MPKKAKERSALEVRRLAKRPGFHSVGGVAGLYLQVGESSCSWILFTTVGEKRRQIGLGAHPDVTLEQARSKARELRQQIEDGVDPVAERRKAKATLKAARQKETSFEDAARQCHTKKMSEFRSSRHADNWIRSLEMYAFPQIGRVPVSEVELGHILSVLEPIWHSKTETAKRVRQRMESVLSWAKPQGLREGENPARWKDHLDHILPKPSKISQVVHYPALPWDQMGSFMRELRRREGMAARALEFLILTWARSGEVRLMPWEEIDLKAKLWVIPAERMKHNKEHRVPLSDPAVDLLRTLPRQEECPYVFWGPRGGPLSDMTISAVLKRMGADAVPHGMRSSAKDWARNCTRFEDEVSELQLAHVNNDRTRAAYARDQLLPKRKQLVNAWAAYCNTIKGTWKPKTPEATS